MFRSTNCTTRGGEGAQFKWPGRGGRHPLWLRYFNLQSISCLDPPTVRLEVGKLLNLNDLEEGDDIYFDCVILTDKVSPV
jgi:hypothetical protein